jgi:hypothetical protein
MNNLRRLGGAAVLMSVLGLAAFAGEIPTPPCGPNPGETSNPPCASQQSSSDPTAPGETSTPPVTESFDFLSLAETALALVF